MKRNSKSVINGNIYIYKGQDNKNCYHFPTLPLRFGLVLYANNTLSAYTLYENKHFVFLFSETLHAIINS